MIPRETLDRVFAAAKIEEVVSDYVTLKRRGANMIGLCPFHNEKTGSFTVSPSKGIYKCFGCGKSGHAIGFVMEIEQCGFSDAVKQLAKKYHIEIEERELTKEEQQREDDRESMFVVNDFANKWFQDQLWNTPEGQSIGLSYFRERGVREDIIRKFELGFAPEKGNPLAAALKKQGFVDKYTINNVDTKIGTGLVGQSEDGRTYDRFRDRVIFPIHTVSGKTVAFAGRILRKKYDKDGKEIPQGKYVNSPDSIIYSKTNELYGLFRAKQAISKNDLCYLVEGQMDVISMYQAGIENVVASGGTALTKPQIRLIRRFTPNITVLYDGDAAGIHAALRGIDMFLEEGFNVKVVLLPDGEDPDSFAKSHNASDFIAYIESHQTDFIRFKAKLLSEEAGRDPQKRAGLIKDVVESIAQIPDAITRQVYIKDCADQLHIQEQLLMREVRRIRQDKAAEREKERKSLERQRELTEAAEQVPSTEQPAPNADAPQLPQVPGKRLTKFEENYRNLLQLIIRYGEKDAYPVEGGYVSVGDYIISTLEADCIEAPNALYRKVVDEFLAHKNDTNFKADTFFKFHPDTAISALAVDLIADKYQLSRMYAKQNISENVTHQVKLKTDEDNLPELLARLLLELKLTVINERIDNLERLLKEAQESGNDELMRELLISQPQLLDVRNQICKQLGNRIITI